MKKFLSLSLWTVLGLLTHIHALIENQFGQYPDICPELCYSAGPEPANWQQYHNVEDLSDCNQDLIFDFNVQGLLNNHEIHKTFRACAFASKEISIPPLNWTRSAYPKGANAVVSRQAYNGSSSNHPDCGAMTEPVTVTPSIGQLGIIQSSLDADEVASAASHLSAYLNNGASCDTTILFAKSGDSIVGLYSGADIENSGAASIIQDFHHHVGRGSPALQICDTSIDTDRTFGLFASRLDKLFQVQEAVRNWTNSFCLESLENSRPLEATQLNIFRSAKKISPGKFNSTTNVNNTSLNTTSLVRRDDCKPIQVVSGDDCGKLATRCGVSGNDFEQYNSGVPNLCSSLKAKEWLCCSPGTLNPPYLGPNPNPDGSCFTYTVQPKDGCFAIADAHQITQDDIENFNKNTWGWGSCDPTALQAGQVICLSKGSPPMPAPVPNTQCGPQVPGTQKPSDMTTLPDLNTCPLNACCDVWGFCGTTAEFCTPTPSKTGAPGSAQPGTNSCISNCGTDIINNQNAPAAFAQVGYFEAWNQNRRCLTMDVDQIPKGFTHIHFSFASLTSNFQINITGIEDQLSKFVKITGYRKVLSFGGWDFSTMPATYQIFRDATKPENRDTFANNVIAFLKQNQLDGVDFDWEYPGAPDIPNVPPGGADEGANYLAFLTLLRQKMLKNTSISIALPASFWYLKQFPVANMSSQVDYFIYMTYDFHGQWDSGNNNSIPGCKSGNCLRSHVNKTETQDSLSMITKAGVPANKIMVGVSSYGRSFRMVDPSCTGPLCTYTGDRLHSNAFPGLCTDTPGYIGDAEIREIIQYKDDYKTVNSYHDDSSDSDILIYGDDNGTDYVGYMDQGTKSKRIDWVKGLNFAGTTDWAIDLENYLPYTGNDTDGDFPSSDNIKCTSDIMPATLEDLSNNLDTIPANCQMKFTMYLLQVALDDALKEFDEISNKGYDKQFGYYVDWVKDGISPRLAAYMDFDTGPGNQYFTCEWLTGTRTEKSKCPPTAKIWQQNEAYTITYTLDDQKGFFDAIEKDLGISEDWVKFGNIDNNYDCADSGEPRPGGGNKPCRQLYKRLHAYPMKGDKVDVTNPKDVIQSAMSNLTNVRSAGLAALFDISLGTFNGEGEDPVTALSMPVFMIQDAIDSMKKIKDIGEKVAEEKKKDLILLILSIVLMVLPFVGEAGGALFGGAAMVGRVALIISEAGNAALGIEQIVGDPLSAPFVLIGMLAGIGGAGGRPAYKEAADARRMMKPEMIAKFPTSFIGKDSLIQKITALCVKK